MILQARAREFLRSSESRMTRDGQISLETKNIGRERMNVKGMDLSNASDMVYLT